MGLRSRNIKPGFFANENLAAFPHWTRLLFIGLWMVADREGRLELRVRRIKRELFPDEDVNVSEGIDMLAGADPPFLAIYEVDGKTLAQVMNWEKHQNPHHKETASTLPPPPGCVGRYAANYKPLDKAMRDFIYARDGRICAECGATERLSIDHIHPIARGGNSVPENLRVLCLTCNSRKGARVPDASAVDESSMGDARSKEVAPCPTDSGFLIPDPGYLIPDWLDREAWSDWDAYRTALGKKEWTDKAKELSIRRLEKFRDEGSDPRDVIEQSIAAGYRGLFADKGKSNGKGQRGAAERVAAATRERARRER